MFWTFRDNDSLTITITMSMLSTCGQLYRGRCNCCPAVTLSFLACMFAAPHRFGGGGGQVDEALRMLQQAAELSATHYGPLNPGQLGALLDYLSALMIVSGHQAAAQAAASQALAIVMAVGERYRAQADLLSAALLYEAAVLVRAPWLGRDDVLLKPLSIVYCHTNYSESRYVKHPVHKLQELSN